MGREILFRGKRVDNGEWAYGSVLIIPVVNLRYIFTGKIDIRNWSPEKHEVDPETVGQFIGFCDKNGMDIYEGDVLKHILSPEAYEDAPPEDNPSEENLLHQVIWVDHGFYLWRWLSEDMKPIPPSGISDQFEIIGNIYDNPELLKEVV